VFFAIAEILERRVRGEEDQEVILGRGPLSRVDELLRSLQKPMALNTMRASIFTQFLFPNQFKNFAKTRQCSNLSKKAGLSHLSLSLACRCMPPLALLTLDKVCFSLYVAQLEGKIRVF